MYHLFAYTKLIDNTVDNDVTALNDDILTIFNSHFILPQNMLMLGATGMSATLDRVRLASATLRQIANPYVRPVIAAATPGNNPNMMLLDHNPPTIPRLEEIQMLATSTVAMGTERFTGLVWVSEGIQQIPTGNVYPLRYTSTTAAVANAWTSVSVTFQDTIPSGLYAIIFSEHQSTNAQAHRWIISNQTWRPGLPSFTAWSQRLPYAIAKGQWGQMGIFRSTDPPRLQVLCNGADATHTGFLHVIRIGNIM